MGSAKVHRLLFFLFLQTCSAYGNNHSASPVDVGFLIDLSTLGGQISNSCVWMAVEDFYSSQNHTKRLVIHTRRYKHNDVIGAATAAVALLKEERVEAILGPIRSGDAQFIAKLGEETQTPIISFTATSPSLTNLTQNPYFVRATQLDSAQAGAVQAIVKAYGWGEIVLVHEDTEYGKGLIPYLTDTLQTIDVKLPYRAVIPSGCTDVFMKEQLYKLMSMQTRVFVVHMLPDLGIRFFSYAQELGMMSKGYVWIVTNGMGDVVDSMDSSAIASMQGVMAVKTFIPRSKALGEFTVRWKRRFRPDVLDVEKPRELRVFGLWAYDTIWALATAIERSDISNSWKRSPGRKPESSLDFENLDVSPNGPKLLREILKTKFKGLSGEFELKNRQLSSTMFEIVNVIGKGERQIGFWSPTEGLFNRQQNGNGQKTASGLKSMIWPGDCVSVPKGWVVPTNAKKLRIGVPVKHRYKEFVNVEFDRVGNNTKVEGYSIDVFKAVLEILPYALPYELVPFADGDGKSAGSYDDLLHQLYLGKFDAVVGDITIEENRTNYVDFTMPYTESGVSMLVPLKVQRMKNALIFLRPLTTQLWLAIGAAFVLTALVVWVLEHRINPEFRGPLSQHIGSTFYFAFSTMVFAHREKLQSNLTRFVIIVWVFVVLILNSSYTASMSSILTAQQLKPIVTDVESLRRGGYSVGCPGGALVPGLVKRLGFDDSKIKVFHTAEDYLNALNNGEVAAVFDEVPYLKLFLSKYCSGFQMVGPTFRTGGFGFVFPQRSRFVPDFSRALLNVTEGDRILAIEKYWFEKRTSCLNNTKPDNSNNSLSLSSLWGLFLLTGITSFGALIAHLCLFLMDYLKSNNSEIDSEGNRRNVSQKLASPIDGHCYCKEQNDHDVYNVMRERTGNGNAVADEEEFHRSNRVGETMNSSREQNNSLAT